MGVLWGKLRGWYLPVVSSLCLSLSAITAVAKDVPGASLVGDFIVSERHKVTITLIFSTAALAWHPC